VQRPSLLLAAFSTLALTAACGSEIIDPQTSGSTTGADGATSTTSTTTSTTTTTGTGGAPAACGWPAGPCGPDAWCQYASATCGKYDGGGTCQPKPEGCTADCPGVCGCDGKFYCNTCGANMAGFDVYPGLSCVTAEDAYRAANLYTNVPRFGIVKASPSRNLCFRLVIEPSMSLGIGIHGDGWAVTLAEVTSDVSDCDFPPGWPPVPAGASFQSMSGMGSLTVAQASASCAAGIDATVKFPGAPAWAPADEAFYANGLAVEGGCW